jgi:hypothetical protein
MSDDNPTQTGALGAMPEPESEPRDPNPGGVDALPEDADNIPADLDHNPAVDETPDPVKKGLSEPEDTQTAATKSESADDVDHEDESPA